MFDKVNIPIVGLIENMSYFICDGCNKNMKFSRAGRAAGAERFKFPISVNSNHGRARVRASITACRVCARPSQRVSKSFLEIAAKLAGQLSIASEQAKKTQGLKIVSS